MAQPPEVIAAVPTSQYHHVWPSECAGWEVGDKLADKTVFHDADAFMNGLVVQALGVDIALAALLGTNIYGFGELLLHPIVSLTP